MPLLRFPKTLNTHTKLTLENHSSVSILTAFFGVLDFNRFFEVLPSRHEVSNKSLHASANYQANDEHLII